MNVHTPVPFPVLQEATWWLAPRVGLPEQIKCVPLSPRDGNTWDGRTNGRTVIEYARVAPLLAVAHELAHWLAPDPDDEHNARWSTWFELLTGMLEQR